MKYVVEEFYYTYFVSNGYNYMASGYMHNIFEKEGKIIKIVKSKFLEFDSEENYLLEQKCLRFLKEQGFPTPEVYKVGKLKIKGNTVYYLEEEKIEGTIKCYDEMGDKEKDTVFQMYQELSKIKGEFYGPLLLNYDEKYSTWDEYLNFLLTKAKGIVERYNLDIRIEDVGYKIKQLLKNEVECSFLLFDPNEKNFIFDDKGVIAGIIDIDHPIFGDKLYQLALFNYFRNDYFNYLVDRGFISEKEIEIIKLYTIVFSLNDVYFRVEAEKSNCVDIEKYISKILDVYNKIIGEVI